MRIDAPAITGSFTIGTTTLPDGDALATTGSNTFRGNQTINGTIVATGTTLVSSSVQVDVMSATNIARLATTGSNTLQGTQTINGSLVVTGSLTAQQFIVSSSVTYLTESFASGSHKFGDSLDDNHNFTGSVYVSGSYAGIKYFSGGGMYVSTDTSYDTSRSYTFRDAVGISNPNGLSATTGTTVMSIGSMANGTSLITTGYIGVKKNSTNAELDVNGNAIISGSLTTTGDITVNSNGAIFNRTSSGEPYLFFRKDGVNRGSIYGITGGGLRMFDQSDNQVFTMTGSMIGIGNTTPSYPLDVLTSSAGTFNTIIQFQNTDYTSGNKSYLRVRQWANAGGSYSSYFGTGQDGNLYIIANNSARGGDLSINAGTGYVGIQMGSGAPITTLDVAGSVGHNNGSTYRSIEFFRTVSASTSAANLYTVTIGSSNTAVFYEVIIFGGDWSNHSAARTIKRGFFCPNGGYTPHSVVESAGVHAANITLGYSQSTNAFTTTLTLDSGTVTLLCHIRIVGDISSYS
jgi:hypothetical protein